MRNKKINKRRPYIVVVAKRRHSQRTIRKRHVSECDAKPGHCCKKTLYVNFKELGWDDWIIKPDGYFANYCEGNCPDIIMPDQLAHRHSEILEHFKHRNREKASYKFCCSPRKMRSLPLLYINESGNIIKTNLANMSVEECGCA